MTVPPTTAKELVAQLEVARTQFNALLCAANDAGLVVAELEIVPPLRTISGVRPPTVGRPRYYIPVEISHV